MINNAVSDCRFENNYITFHDIINISVHFELKYF